MRFFNQITGAHKQAVQAGRALRVKMIRVARDFAADEKGATSIEYGLIVSLIFLAIVGAIRSFTDETAVLYGKIEDGMTTP